MAINRLHLMNSILKLRLTDELQVQHLFKIMWLDIIWWWIELHHHHHYTNKMLWPNWGLKIHSINSIFFCQALSFLTTSIFHFLVLPLCSTKKKKKFHIMTIWGSEAKINCKMLYVIADVPSSFGAIYSEQSTYHDVKFLYMKEYNNLWQQETWFFLSWITYGKF